MNRSENNIQRIKTLLFRSTILLLMLVLAVLLAFHLRGRADNTKQIVPAALPQAGSISLSPTGRPTVGAVGTSSTSPTQSPARSPVLEPQVSERDLREWLKKLSKDPELARAYELDVTADSLLDDEKWKEAEAVLQELLQILRKRPETQPTFLGIVVNNLAFAQMTQFEPEKYPIAERGFQEALRIHLKEWGETHDTVAKDYNNLGLVNEYAGKFDESEMWQKKALDIRERLYGKNSIEVSISYFNLGSATAAKGDFRSAEKYFKDALFIREKELGTNDPQTISTGMRLANIYRKTGREQEAIELEGRLLR